MMRTVLAILALGLSAPALAGEKHDAVMDLLNGFEDPVREADLAALGDGVEVELMQIAEDKAVPATRRGRAVSALQYYRTDAVRAFLEKHLADPHDGLIRRKAAWSLAAWGEPAVPLLTGALGDADVQLRIAAAQALGTIPHESAKAALRARLSAETESAVKDAIGKSLGEVR